MPDDVTNKSTICFIMDLSRINVDLIQYNWLSKDSDMNFGVVSHTFCFLSGWVAGIGKSSSKNWRCCSTADGTVQYLDISLGSSDKDMCTHFEALIHWKNENDNDSCFSASLG